MKFELYAAKCEAKLKEFEANRFDSGVTDGPYGIRFMGKAWDSFDITKGHKAREDRNKNEKVRGNRKSNGFGKSLFAGKYNTTLNANRQFQEWTTKVWLELYRVLKPGAHIIAFGSPRTFHRLVCGIEDAGFEIRDTMMWVFGSGFPKSHNLTGEFEGWGTALKPAYEPICLARKPLEKGLNVADNMKKWGTGALDIDSCRIPGEEWTFGSQNDIRGGGYNTKKPSNGDVFAKNVVGGQNGRWPANLIHDGSPGVLTHFPDAPGQQGDLIDHKENRESKNGIYGKFSAARDHLKRKEESLSAARFFYVPKTSRADRNEGCESLPLVTGGMVSNTSGQHITRREDDYVPVPVHNNHPTVKPTELMQYLVTMVTRPEGECIDQFCGSGSTMKACAIEGINCVGIDEDAHNIEISRLRTQWILNHLDLFGKFRRPK